MKKKATDCWEDTCGFESFEKWAQPRPLKDFEVHITYATKDMLTKQQI